MILAYLMVCCLVWAVLQTLSEMTIVFPTSGNFIDYADRWVDPALAFGAGFAEWLGWTAIVAAEAMFFVVLTGFWADGKVPVAVLRKVRESEKLRMGQSLTLIRSDFVSHRHFRYFLASKYLFRLVRICHIDHQDISIHSDHHRGDYSDLRCWTRWLLARSSKLYGVRYFQEWVWGKETLTTQTSRLDAHFLTPGFCEMCSASLLGCR